MRSAVPDAPSAIVMFVVFAVDGAATPEEAMTYGTTQDEFSVSLKETFYVRPCLSQHHRIFTTIISQDICLNSW